ncbi:hypothetical protein CSPX01_02784 [Colletotrichum filicis]|nr:hypothetical protein CSPX01_02784 [Colletotrichum filicis]
MALATPPWVDRVALGHDQNVTVATAV